MRPNLARPLSAVLVCAMLFVVAGPVVGPAAAQDGGPGEGLSVEALAGTGFTYQGELRSGGSPVNGNCDFQFSLWDAVSSGVQQGSTQPANNVSVAGGRFTVVLNSAGQFGARAFDGSARWLAIAVRCPAGGGGFTNLTPRQELTAAPLALALPGLRTEINPTSPNVIGGHISNTVTTGVVGGFIGGGAGHVISASVNYAVIAGGQSNRAGNLHVAIGGGTNNQADGPQSVIAGGQGNHTFGTWSAVGGGVGNNAGASYTTVAGGFGNNATAQGATVAGGRGNLAAGQGAFVGGGGWSGVSQSGNAAWGDSSAIGAGFGNIITPTDASDFSFIGAGEANKIYANDAVIGGGFNNTISSGANMTVIGGGSGNTASAVYSFVGGGQNNQVSASHAAVLGGHDNSAGGQNSVVAGGRQNMALGPDSFAAGYGARANHAGSWVWVCSACAVTNSPGADTFVVNASGGIWFGRLTGVTPITPTIGAGVFISTSTNAYLTTSGVWTDVSDRNAKTAFAPVDRLDVLQALMAMPLESWSYRVDETGARHIGPTAQDFRAAFGVGDSDVHLAALDTSGVALAAIQGLYGVVLEKEAVLTAQQAEIAALSERVAALEAGETAQRAVSANALPWLLLAGLGLLNAGGAAGYALARRGRGRGL